MPAIDTAPRVCFRNILFTTDFSAASEAAVPYVEALAGWFDARVFMVHSVPPQPMLSVPMEPMPVSTDLTWEDAECQMVDFRRRHPLRGVSCETVLERGDLWPVVCDVIRRHNIDLVVLGTHGRKGLKKVVLGSAAEELFRRVACPVLTVGPQAFHPRVKFESWKRILFATDFSKGSLKALPYALSLAEENLAQLTLLHLVALVPMQRKEEVIQHFTDRLRALVPAEAASWCTPQYVVELGFAADAIPRIAEQRQSDLIVMGVHATQHPRFVSHSAWAIAYDAVCQSSCPVLTVRG